MRRLALLIPLLLLTDLFFGWKTYEAWTAPAESLPRAPAPSAEAPAPAETAAAAPASDLSGALAAIVARPLFRPDRRPFQENVAAAPQRNFEAELARFTVLGVIVIGKSEKAIITGKEGSRDERYEVGPGDRLPGFQVKEIRSEGVQVTADDREFTLPLYAGSPKIPAGGALRTEVAMPATLSPAPGAPAARSLPRAGAPASPSPVPSPPARPLRPSPIASQPQSAQSATAVLPPYPTPSSATYAPESAPAGQTSPQPGRPWPTSPRGRR